MFAGDLRCALDMLADQNERPRGIPDGDFELGKRVDQALQSGAGADRTAAVDAHLAAARQGLGYSRNAALFATVLGDLDAAFEAANAYFFDEPFKVTPTYFSREQGEYAGVRSRETSFLFAPSSPRCGSTRASSNSQRG